jgi:hypothetical protein
MGLYLPCEGVAEAQTRAIDLQGSISLREPRTVVTCRKIGLVPEHPSTARHP